MRVALVFAALVIESSTNLTAVANVAANGSVQETLKFAKKLRELATEGVK